MNSLNGYSTGLFKNNLYRETQDEFLGVNWSIKTTECKDQDTEPFFRNQPLAVIARSVSDEAIWV